MIVCVLLFPSASASASFTSYNASFRGRRLEKKIGGATHRLNFEIGGEGSNYKKEAKCCLIDSVNSSLEHV
jgi:hypothetical protein